MTVTGLVLAAGGGSRYGMPKALAPYRGGLLVEHAAGTLRAAGVARTVVVLGAAARQVRAVADLRDAVTVDNPDWPTGLASSLRAGLSAAGGTAVVVLLVDMPGVTAEAVRRITAGSVASSLVMAGYGERRGHPVLLGRDHWAGVADAATGDSGARAYLRAHAAQVRVVDCADVADDTDLDVPTHA